IPPITITTPARMIPIVVQVESIAFLAPRACRARLPTVRHQGASIILRLRWEDVEASEKEGEAARTRRTIPMTKGQARGGDDAGGGTAGFRSAGTGGTAHSGAGSGRGAGADPLLRL